MEPTYLQRLSFIKYLFSIALYQSNQPEPLSGVCILSFHDSVELFLLLTHEKFNIFKKSQNFMDYWEIIDNKIGNDKLSQKESMRRLNKARAQLKHHGILPSKLDIESYRVTTLAFFNENCPIIFAINFDDITLIDCINFKRPRESLIKAKQEYEDNLINDALQDTALSFYYLLSDYENNKLIYHSSPFFIGESMTFIGGSLLNFMEVGTDLSSFAGSVIKSIKAIQEVLKILCFGIDYKKYIRFKTIVPSFDLAMDGSPLFHTGSKLELARDDFDFCVSFIVESALKLQEFDFELNIP